MLTDDELTRRLGAAFRGTVPEMEYGGRVPHVRHHGGLATTSVLAAGVALALAPALAPIALEQGPDRTPGAVPGLRPDIRPSGPAGRTVTHTVDFGGLRLTYASVDGKPGPLYFVGGPDLRVPAGAEKLDLDLPVDAWYVPDAADGEPALYIRHRGGCPDTQEGCPPGYMPPLYGLLATGWTREQLVGLLEHPVEAQGGR
jgi:hypothetical protein